VVLYQKSHGRVGFGRSRLFARCVYNQMRVSPEHWNHEGYSAHCSAGQAFTLLSSWYAFSSNPSGFRPGSTSKRAGIESLKPPGTPGITETQSQCEIKGWDFCGRRARKYSNISTVKTKCRFRHSTTYRSPQCRRSICLTTQILQLFASTVSPPAPPPEPVSTVKILSQQPHNRVYVLFSQL
jgi:hypothetical protein